MEKGNKLFDKRKKSVIMYRRNEKELKIVTLGAYK